MSEASRVGGRTIYASTLGETNFRQRHPQHLSQTLSFMLGREECRFITFRTGEEEPLRECLLWLRRHNPHLKVLYTNFERFGTMYERLQTLIPQGKKDVPVRVRRTRRVDDEVNSTLIPCYSGFGVEDAAK